MASEAEKLDRITITTQGGKQEVVILLKQTIHLDELGLSKLAVEFNLGDITIASEEQGIVLSLESTSIDDLLWPILHLEVITSNWKDFKLQSKDSSLPLSFGAITPMIIGVIAIIIGVIIVKFTKKYWKF